MNKNKMNTICMKAAISCKIYQIRSLGGSIENSMRSTSSGRSVNFVWLEDVEKDEDVVNLTYFSSFPGSQDKDGTTAVFISTVLHFTLNHIFVLFVACPLSCQLIKFQN